jgi:anti-anti-sigma factor
MVINLSVENGVIRAAPRGPIDSTTAPALQEPLLAAIAANKVQVELDFSLVPYISSAGLRVLVLAAKELKPLGIRMRLTGVSGTVLQVLNLANFGAFLDIETAN